MKKRKFKVWFYNYPAITVKAVSEGEAARRAYGIARQDKSLTFFQKEDLEVSTVDSITEVK